MKKQIWTCIFGGMLCGLVSATLVNNTVTKNTNLKSELKNEDQDYLKESDIKTKCSQSTITAVNDTETMESLDVEFDNQLKKIYLSGNPHQADSKMLMKACKQITSCKNDGRDYGRYSFKDLTEVMDDAYARIEDWIQHYSNNLNIDVPSGIDWGITIPSLSLNNELLWSKGTNARSIKPSIGYADKDSVKTIFDNGNQCAFYCKGDSGITNIKTNLTGLPFVFYKDCIHTPLAGAPFANVYSLSACGTATNTTRNMDITNVCEPVIGKYNINNLICINGGSYQDKTIRLGINQTLLDQASHLQDYHNQIKNKISDLWINTTSKLKSCDGHTLQELIDSNFLDEDNADNFMKHCQQYTNNFNFLDAYNWLKINRSTKEINYLKQLGLNENDNPQIMLNDLQSKLSFKVNYAIHNLLQPDQWQSNIMHVTYQDLSKGVDIPLSQNQQGDYQFRLDYINSDEINNADTYVEDQSTNKISVSANNVETVSENLFTLSEAVVNNATFLENDESYNQNYFPNDLTDEKVFKKYVRLTTNYQEDGDLSLLDKSQYTIDRDEINGLVKIIININGQIIENTFNGFKMVSKQIPDIDGSLDVYNLTCGDLDNLEIRKLLVLNNFDRYVVNQLECDVVNQDDINGNATIQVNDCTDENLNQIYKHEIFHIKKLAPYYIRQKQNIDASIASKKPNEITTNDCIASLVDMSDEFKNRNLDNLKIDLKPQGDHTLVVSIAYIEKNKEVNVEYTYSIFSLSHSNLSLILWIIVGTLSVASVGTISYFIWKKFHKRHLN